MSKDFIDLAKELTAWTKGVFPEATAYSSLQKLKSEIEEIEYDLEGGKVVDMEYADAIMCLLDSAARAGISMEEIVEAFEAKLEINKKRKWKKNSDNTYSHIR